MRELDADAETLERWARENDALGGSSEDALAAPAITILLARYQSLVEKRLGALKSRPWRDATSTIDQLTHVHWMCAECASFSDREKVMRWLGFIQGVLWTSGLRTIDALRDETRQALQRDQLPAADDAASREPSGEAPR